MRSRIATAADDARAGASYGRLHGNRDRRSTMNDPIPGWVGVAAVLAGLSFFVGHAGELILATDALDAVLVALIGAGLAAFGVALWGLRRALAGTRRARIGLRLALVGAAL